MEVVLSLAPYSVGEFVSPFSPSFCCCYLVMEAKAVIKDVSVSSVYVASP